jgi:hypothetical protein
MRKASVLTVSAALVGPVLIGWCAWVPVIPSWQIFNVAAPLAVAVVSLVAIWVANHMHRKSVSLSRGRKLLPWLLTVMVTSVTGGMCLFTGIEAGFGPYPERTYLVDARRKVYLFERACMPPDGKTECSEYWTEIRTQIAFLPFTRVITRCSCLYAEPRLTASTIEFEVDDMYVPDTPSAIIDRRTLSLRAR